MGDAIWELKLWASAVLFLLTFVSGLVPVWISQRSGGLLSPRVISLGNCLTAGIFLTMGISHVLAEAAEDESNAGDSWGLGGRVHLHLFMLAFILVLGIECFLAKDIGFERKESEKSYELKLLGGSEKSDKKKSGHDHFDSCEKKDYTSFILLAAAMSLHSTSTGMALGVQTEKGSAITLLIAIASHKSIETCALAFSLLRNVDSLARRLLIIFGYSLLSPIGIILGAQLSSDKPFFQMSIKSISAGTLFYIAGVEIVSEEFGEEEATLEKYCGLFAGMLIMVSSAVLFAEN